MNNLNINNLFNKRIEVIKAEIGALLFNLGKTHIGFWREKKDEITGQKVKYFSIDENCFEREYGYKVFGGYRDYYKERDGISPFEKDLNSANDKLKEVIYKTKLNLNLFDIKEMFLYEIIYGDALPEAKQNKLNNIFFRGCENINSGIDKGVPKKQLNNLWISNAFGSFNEEISFNGDVKRMYFDEKRRSFFSKLGNKLSSFGNGPDNLTYENWTEIRQFILKEIKERYSYLLSDSRFPANDVTLWDQAYMTASLFKASIAAMLLDNNKCQKYETPKNIKWSILGIQYDKLSLINKSLKSHFISWYNENINKCDEEIKRIIEEKYALGNEIYRDETGIYFIVPENISHEKDKELSGLHNDLYMVKENILDVFNKVFADEIYPSIFITRSSRGTMNLAYLIEKSKENFLKPTLPENFCEGILSCSNINYNGICQVCGIKPGKKEDGEDNMILCDQCSDRKESKMVKWFKNPENETIWTGELQDEKGRIALITLKFELQEWLNGDFLNSLIMNDVIHNQVSYKDYLNTIKQLLANMQKRYNQFLLGDKKNLSKIYGFYSENRTVIGEFLNLFDKDGIKLPHDDVVRKIVNIFNEDLQKEDDKRLKELFRNEFFDFLKRNWHFIREKNEENKDDDNYIIYDEKGEFIYKIESKEINFKNPSFKNHYGNNTGWKLVTDIFSFAYLETQINNILLERAVGDRWEILIREKLNTKVDFKNRKIEWDKLSDDDIDFLSGILLQFLIRKNPSPARLRRITETTKEFLDEIKKDLLCFMFEDKDKKEWRIKRIVWHIDNLKDNQKNREYEYKGLEFMTDDFGNVYLISSIEQAIDIIRNIKKEDKREKSEIHKEVHEAIKSENCDWIKDKLSIEPKYKNKNSQYDKHDEKIDGKIELRRENATYKKYLPYISIMDPTPIMWQFIVPSECIPQIIKTVQKRYNECFKYVIGKLPLHIGVIIQDYKKPIYVGLKALRDIKRDIDDFDKIKKEISTTELDTLRNEGLNCKNKHEILEPLGDVYSLYEVNGNYGKYKFYINPDKKENIWIDTTVDKAGDEKFYIYPNTIDFEFLDVNTRKNDIFYGENGKRATQKKNRPYTWTEWKLFKKFFEYFNKENCKTRLQNIISLMYSKIEEWGNETEGLKHFMLSSFINILDLKGDKDKLNEFSTIFGKDNWDELANTPSENFKKDLMMFIDMYEFWHKALKKL
ncbi:MAG: CRISPR-associated protein Csx11 [Firmicutes bacterium]|nr:CRISPR-associated protein Csx11 [Bacillota bacterium]